MTVLEFIIVFLFPPLAVAMRTGVGGKFFVNLLLTILGWFPGVIHAFIVLSRHKTYKVDEGMKV